MRFPHLILAAALLTPVFAGSARAAAGPAGHGHGEGPGASLAGEPARRGQGQPMTIQMTEYAYNTKTLSVKAGDTVRFMIANKGALLHEFNVNTAAEHAEHRPMMAEMMEHGMITPEKVISLTMTMADGQKMTHTEPNSILLESGKGGEMSWRFTKPGDYEIACNIPGHYESGMVIRVNVQPR